MAVIPVAFEYVPLLAAHTFKFFGRHAFRKAMYDRPWDHADCYALHLRHTGKLSAKLYPDDVYRPTKRYPEDFHNRDKRLNLGANNTVFPLVSLVKGFMQLGAGLLSSPELFEHQKNAEQLCTDRTVV